MVQARKASPHPDSPHPPLSGAVKPRGQPTIAATATQTGMVVETDIPARLDALPVGRFHILVIVALGITWILDGLEVTLAGALSGELTQSSGLGLSNAQIGIAGSSYLCGAVLGAFFFGWLTDRLGRKKLFFITLAVYLTATAATGFSWDVWSFVLFRFLTGTGIGGEYTAINSTIQELIPGAPARLDRSSDQRKFLDRSGAGGGRLDRPAQSCLYRSGAWLAARVPDRSFDRTDHPPDATLDSGKPPLADDPWLGRRSRGRRARHRGPCWSSAAAT